MVASFAGIVGFREQINYKYGATDFYFICVLTCSEKQDIAIEDTQEVKTAQWVSLEKIADHNREDEPPDYFFYQTPYEFIARIKAQLTQRKEGESMRHLFERVNFAAYHTPILQGIKQKFNFYTPKI